MAKSRNAAIIGGISVAVIIGIAISVIAGTSPLPEDQETGTVPIPPVASEDTVDITESSNVSTGAEFYITEEGNKVFIVSATDTPEPEG